MMGNFFYAYQCDDIYGEGSIEGVRYGMVEAVDMKDARQSLGNRRRRSVNGMKLNARNIRKIQVKDGEIASEYPYFSQWVRREIYEGSRLESELDFLLPGWRKLDRDHGGMGGFTCTSTN